jgi:pimeloyl-ACP methyl ester carboxylesterase
MIGIDQPERVKAVILEAFHFYRSKPASREFFQTMAGDPDLLGERTAATLAREHGDDYWRRLIVTGGRAWLQIADESVDSKHDLYDGRLSELGVSALFLHGSRDPRTEPGEMEAVREQLPIARIEIIEGGGHSPHSESMAFGECNRIAREFLESLR